MLERHSSHLRVVRPPHHLGMMVNWNVLVRQLVGDWISLIPSDDIALPNYVADLTSIAMREPDAVLVRGCVEFIDHAGNVR